MHFCIVYMLCRLLYREKTNFSHPQPKCCGPCTLPFVPSLSECPEPRSVKREFFITTVAKFLLIQGLFLGFLPYNINHFETTVDVSWCCMNKIFAWLMIVNISAGVGHCGALWNGVSGSGSYIMDWNRLRSVRELGPNDWLFFFF